MKTLQSEIKESLIKLERAKEDNPSLPFYKIKKQTLMNLLKPIEMTPKQFAQSAIRNGYTGSECKGWDYINQNLSSLARIFKSEAYKQQNGMKYKCMPFLTNNQNLLPLEEFALATAWYLNNQAEHKNKEDEYKAKMSEDGWLKLTPEALKSTFTNKQKLRVKALLQNDWLNSGIDKVFKPFVNNEGHCFLMKPKARSKGLNLHYLKHAFYKIV